MRPLAYLRIPLLRPIGAALTKGNDIPKLQESSITFRLVHVADEKHRLSGRVFYECCQDACAGAGCESWPAADREIPEAVMEHLYLHAALCEGVKR